MFCAHTLEAGRVIRVGSHLAVHLHEALHEDHNHLPPGQGIFEAVANENNERQAFSGLVRARARLGSPLTAQLIQHPVPRRIEAL